MMLLNLYILGLFWIPSCHILLCLGFISRYAAMLGIIDHFPRLEPFPKYHQLGMLQAIMINMRSMEPGKGKDGRVKYDMSQKIWSTFTILWDCPKQTVSFLRLNDSVICNNYLLENIMVSYREAIRLLLSWSDT